MDPNQSSQPPDETQNMAALRDLLFGKKSREIDERFQGLEDNLRQDLKSLRDSLNKQFSGLEDHLRSQLTNLERSLAEEQNARRNEDSALKQILDAMDQHFDQQLQATQRNLAHARQQAAEELNASRAELADLLVEVANRLHPTGNLAEDAAANDKVSPIDQAA